MAMSEGKENSNHQGRAGQGADDKPALAPIAVTHPATVDSGTLRLFREPPWRLRLTIEGDRSYLKVKVVLAAPLSYPDRYICLLDAKDEEICMIDQLQAVDEATRRIIEEELDRRYLTAIIERIHWR